MSFDVADPSKETLGFAQPTQLDTETSLVVKLATAELNQAVTTARAFPRSVARAMTNILALATLDAESAGECIYVLPRAGKAIRGPSVRLAEIIASQWGNCQVGSRVVAVDFVDKVVIAEGVFHDLETGMKRIAQVRRRITNKSGKVFDDDMIVVTGNAACSIAMREAVLKGVPKAVWRKAYAACEEVVGGKIVTLSETRDKAIKVFAEAGVTADQLFAYLEVGGIEDVTMDHVITLRTIMVAIKSGENTVEDYFDPAQKRGQVKQEAKAKAVEKADAKPAADPAPEKKADSVKKPEPEPKATAAEPEAKEVAPEPEAKQADPQPVTEEQGGLPLGGDDPQVWLGLYDSIVNALLDRRPADVRDAFGEEIARMSVAAPELHERLMAEFVEFEKQAGAAD